ncbi:histone lysine acetyltransferase hat1 [Cyclospora cayetanensis]|uniref:histone acetyltransferase n=1 Tax=Cyclospora cayetanensis TaxID=88456 RepID=A0A1D3D766_9EIME|nr:histone lysine acetyltransferase hat1 [Cyclospora cayetanensis]
MAKPYGRGADLDTPKTWKRLPAGQCLSFYFPDHAENLQAAEGYSPLFCHSIFGDDEEIPGFEELKLQIFFSSGLRMHTLVLATGSPCEAIGGGGTKTLCLSRRGSHKLQGEAPCWRHLLDCLLSAPFPGDFCETEEEFCALLRQEHSWTAEKDPLLKEGKLWAEAWDESKQAKLQLFSFSVARYSTSPGIARVEETAGDAAIETPRNVQLSAFETLHRRQEWLMRFYIDGTRPLEYDSRWQVVLPLYIREPRSESLACWPNGATLQKRAACTRQAAEGLLQPDQEHHQETNVQNPSYSSSTHSKRLKLAKDAREGGKEGSADPLSEVGSGDNFRAALESSKENSNHNGGAYEGWKVAADTVPPPQHSGAVLQHATCSNKESSPPGRGALPWIEVVGCITTYSFYAMTGGEKLRISQVLVFPQFQGRGLGFRLMECIYTLALQNPRVSAVLVENPAPSFSQLRDAVLLSLCFSSGLLSPQLLRPSWEREEPLIIESNGVDNKESQKTATHLPQKAREILSSFTKETPAQITRLLDILQLAELLPMSCGPGENPNSIITGAGGRGWRTTSQHRQQNAIVSAAHKGTEKAAKGGCKTGDEKFPSVASEISSKAHSEGGLEKREEDLDPSCETFSALRLRVKRRLWNEAAGGQKSFKAEGKATSWNSSNVVSEVVKQQLQKEWLLHFSSYCRLIFLYNTTGRAKSCDLDGMSTAGTPHGMECNGEMPQCFLGNAALEKGRQNSDISANRSANAFVKGQRESKGEKDA